MAADGRMRCRSCRMRGGSKRTSGGGADMMKPRGGIRGSVKSDGRTGKSGGCRIRTHAGASGSVGHIVKPGTVEPVVKPSNANLAEEAWIYVCGCRIERASLRFNSQGDVYVPDSEDDEFSAERVMDGGAGVEQALAVAADGDADVELVPVMALDGGAGVELALAVAADGAAGVDVAPGVAAVETTSVVMNPEVAARLAKKVLGEDLHPEVAALLAEVLSEMKPFYHECFISMYKVMVHLFFTPAPSSFAFGS